jgi:hypothetical protein
MLDFLFVSLSRTYVIRTVSCEWWKGDRNSAQVVITVKELSWNSLGKI